MPALYYKCNNCGYEVRISNYNRKNIVVFDCRICKSKMYYSKQIEREWLNERDEYGNKKRKIIWSTSPSKALKKASFYSFNCKSNELMDCDKTPKWIDIINSIFSTKFCKRVIWKPNYKIDSKAIKIVTEASDVNGWFAINPIDKIIYAREYNFFPLKYDKIISLTYRTIISSVPCKLVLEPYHEVEIWLDLSKEENIELFLDALHNDLPKSENEMYITCFFKKNDISPKCIYSFTECFNDELKIAGCFIWKDDKYLNICDTIIRNGIKIKLDQIKYYRMIGDKYVTTQVSGGGGGGTSIAGAVIGGIIAGGAGAVIGSRKSVEPIQITSSEDDDRTVLIYSKDQTKILKFCDEIYEVLLELLPEKEYEIVINSAKQVPVQPVISNNSTDYVDMRSKLKQLKAMFEEDLITEEEYNRKRQELLGKI